MWLNLDLLIKIWVYKKENINNQMLFKITLFHKKYYLIPFKYLYIYFWMKDQTEI